MKMRKQHTRWSFTWMALPIAAALAWGLSTVLAATAPPIVGDWQGTLSTGSSSLRVVLHVTQNKDEKLEGTVDSPDQGATGIAISSISFKQPDLHFEIQTIASSYDGKMNKDNSEIAGEWKQGGGSLALTFKRVSK